MSRSKKPSVPRAKGPEVILFIMDAPNVDKAIESIIGHRTHPQDRPNYPTLMLALQSIRQRDEILLAKIFVNRSPNPSKTAAQQRWINALQALGFATYLKPRRTTPSDVDSDMLAMLEHSRRSYRLVQVIVASNDGRCFNGPLSKIARQGISVSILGFEQQPSVLTRNPLFTFIPWPSIPGVLPNFPTEGPAPK